MNEIPFEITQEFLLAGNDSITAKRNLKAYRNARETKNQTITLGCGDARTLYAIHNPILRSLATGAALEGYENMMNNGVANIAALGHFDAELIAQELAKEEYTCAARNTKAMQIKSGRRPATSFGKFFALNVTHPMLIPQTLYSALEASTLTPKRILAGVQNHGAYKPGEITPFAILKDGKIIEQSPALSDLMEGRQIIPEGLTGEDAYNRFKQLTSLSEAQLDQDFQKYMAETAAYVDLINLKYPYSPSRQKIHNPRLMVATTSPKHPATRYEGMEIPGVCAVMNIPRLPEVSGSEFTQEEMAYLRDQLSLLAQESNNNQHNPGSAYFNTRNLLVERGNSMEDAKRTVEELLDTSKQLRDWRDRKDTRIFTAHLRRNITDIEVYKNAA